MKVNPHVLSQFPACVQQFLTHANERRFAKGEEVCLANIRVNGFYMVIDGSLKRYGEPDQVTEDDATIDAGKRVLFEYLRRGEFVGESMLLLPGNNDILHDSNVVAEKDSILAHMGAVALGRFRAHYPDRYQELHNMVMELTLHKISLKRYLINELVNLDARRRVRAIINRLALSHGATHPEGVEIKISRQDIAAMVGCSREVAGRVVNDLVAEGKIQSTGKPIVILGGYIKEDIVEEWG